MDCPPPPTPRKKGRCGELALSGGSTAFIFLNLFFIIKHLLARFALREIKLITFDRHWVHWGSPSTRCRRRLSPPGRPALFALQVEPAWPWFRAEEWRILSQNPTDTMKTGSDYITRVEAVYTPSARELVPGKGSGTKWCCVHTG